MIAARMAFIAFRFLAFRFLLGSAACLLGVVTPPSVVLSQEEQLDDRPMVEQPIVRLVPRWDVQPSGVTDDLYAVTFLTPLLGWAVGQNNTIIKTVDGGNTWTRAVDRRERGPTFNEVTFGDEQRGWVKASGTLLYTADGGATWQPASQLARSTDYGPGSVVGGTRFQLGVPGTSASLFRSDDGGRTWTTVTDRLPHNAFGFLSFADLQRGWATYSSTNLMWTTADGGVTWTQVDPSLRFGSTVRFVNPSTGWVFGENGSILLATRDGGQSWDRQSTGLASFQSLADMHFVDQAGGYVLSSSERGTVLGTGNGGASWQSMGTLGAPEHVNAIRFTDAEHGWVVGHRGFIIHYHLVPVEEPAVP